MDGQLQSMAVFCSVRPLPTYLHACPPARLHTCMHACTHAQLEARLAAAWLAAGHEADRLAADLRAERSAFPFLSRGKMQAGGEH